MSHHAESHIRNGCRKLLAMLPHAEVAYAPVWMLAHDLGVPQARVKRNMILLRRAGYGIVSRSVGRCAEYAIPASCWAKAQADCGEALEE